MAINEMIKQAILTPNSRYAFIAPTYKMAKDIVWDYLKHYSRPIPNIKINESELRIDYPNGGRIRLYGSEEPDRLRGLSLNGVIFDEYAQINDKVFIEAVRPALSDKQGWAIWLGTPMGRNHFFNMYVKAQDDPDWATWLIPASTTDAIPKSELEAIKKDIPQATYMQEYECSFLDNAGSFFRRIKDNIYHDRKEIGRSKFNIGVDLAKFQDWTVITPFNLNTFHVYPQKRYNQVDYFLQKETIKSSYHEYNKGKIIMDSTGVGTPVYDDLSREVPDILPFTFTEQSRYQLLTNLQILLEQDKIKIPNDEGLINELEAMHYERLPQGKTKIKVPDSMTDDRVMSLALACWQIVEPLGNVDDDYTANAKKLTEYYKTGTVKWKPDFL